MHAPVSAPWRRVGLSMAAGAIYDLAFAIAIVFFTRPAAGILGLSVPDDPVYLRLVGVLLGLLAGLYSLAWADPIRYQGIVPIAATGRFVGFVYMVWVWRTGGADAFLATGIGDLAFSVLHAVLFLEARRVDPRQVTDTPAA